MGDLHFGQGQGQVKVKATRQAAALKRDQGCHNGKMLLLRYFFTKASYEEKEKRDSAILYDRPPPNTNSLSPKFVLLSMIKPGVLLRLNACFLFLVLSFLFFFFLFSFFLSFFFLSFFLSFFIFVVVVVSPCLYPLDPKLDLCFAESSCPNTTKD